MSSKMMVVGLLLVLPSAGTLFQQRQHGSCQGSVRTAVRGPLTLVSAVRHYALHTTVLHVHVALTLDAQPTVMESWNAGARVYIVCSCCPSFSPRTDFGNTHRYTSMRRLPTVASGPVR